MKHLLILLALVAAMTATAQTKKYTKSVWDSAGGVQYGPLQLLRSDGCDCKIVNPVLITHHAIGETLDSYYGIQYGDTLEIPSSVKVLIIDGKPFDIIRRVEVKPPHAFGEWEPAHQIWTWPYTPAVMDSTSIRIMRHGIDVGPTKHNKP